MAYANSLERKEVLAPLVKNYVISIDTREWEALTSNVDL